MASFKTSDGREWTMRLTVGIAAKIKTAYSVDLMSVKDLFGEVQKLSENRVTFVEAVWLMVSGDVTDADRPALKKLFDNGMDGEAMEAAEAAFEEALLVFSPPRLRGMLAKVFDANKRLGPQAAAKVGALLTTERIDEELDRALSRTAGPGTSGPGSPPESAASTPAPEASGN